MRARCRRLLLSACAHNHLEGGSANCASLIGCQSSNTIACIHGLSLQLLGYWSRSKAPDKSARQRAVDYCVRENGNASDELERMRMLLRLKLERERGTRLYQVTKFDVRTTHTCCLEDVLHRHQQPSINSSHGLLTPYLLENRLLLTCRFEAPHFSHKDPEGRVGDQSEVELHLGRLNAILMPQRR